MKTIPLSIALLVGAGLGAGASLLIQRKASEPQAPSSGAVAAAAEAKPAGAQPVPIALGTAPVRGPADAPVTLVVWADFQCPFCASVEPTLVELRRSYGDKLKLVWKNQPGHEQSLPAAQAAMAAGEQGRFWEFHDALLNNQGRLGPALYEEIARQLGLDLVRFRAASRSDAIRNQVIDDARQGAALGARGTPTFFVDGRILVGAQPIEALRSAIDGALATRLSAR